MKKILLTAMMVGMVFGACRKDSVSFFPNGTIVGWNTGYCITCGGFYVNLSDSTTINAQTYYAVNYAENLDSVIGELYTLYRQSRAPIPVHIEWTAVSASQPYWIRVTSISYR